MIKLGRPVKDMSIEKDTDIEEIFSELQQSGGFESRNLAEGLDILSSMISDKKCLKFLSFVGAIVSTGLRGIIKDIIKNKWFDVV
ncbi:MAG: deoxyhypusine synthase family protein, partial [Nitrosopumilaceae archaeon]